MSASVFSFEGSGKDLFILEGLGEVSGLSGSGKDLFVWDGLGKGFSFNG